MAKERILCIFAPVPNLRPLRIWLLRIGVVAFVLTLQRILFALLNAGALPAPPAAVFVGGIRFDLFAIAWLFMPWTLVALLVERPSAMGAKLQKGLFHLACTIAFALNSIDIAYFRFTLKRSTSDLFTIATGGDDLFSLLPVFLVDYWYIVLIFLASMGLIVVGYLWAERFRQEDRARPWWLWRLLVVALVVLMARGGTQYVPLRVIDASQYGPPAYMPVVLNTPFTVITSLGKPLVAPKEYMSDARADQLWPVMHQYGDTALIPGKPNVVVIVLESFSAAYSGLLNGTGQGHMPFLDSLMTQGQYHVHAYANGRRSIDGIPAVVASLPKMMPEAFIKSPYAQQNITALPDLLAKQGYRTSFFHGGHNGTMGFTGFAHSAGFQRYLGRDEYPDPSDDDGVWGIRDRPFLQFFAQQLQNEREPFMSCLFTLSSHHPYRLPDDEARKFATAGQPALAALRYADDALRDFFATARQMPWYGNTLFVITSDHTAELERDGRAVGGAFDYWIPLLYYMPEYLEPAKVDRVTQQIDILPTVLDLIGYEHSFFALGSSSLRSERQPAAVSENDGTWLLISAEGQLRSDGERVLWAQGPMGAPDDAQEDHAGQLLLLQAAIQQFNNALLRGRLVLAP